MLSFSCTENPNAQRTTAKSKSFIRVEYMLDAVQWLLENNHEWQSKETNTNLLYRELESIQPNVLDASINADSSDSSI